LGLLKNKNIVALIPESIQDETPYIEDGQVQLIIRFSQNGKFSSEKFDPKVEHPLLKYLQERGKGGFIIYSSGSTGKPKAILHDIERFLTKFQSASKRFRTVLFLLFDHIAGLDTLFYTLSSGGTTVIPDERSPKAICQLIEATGAEVLPTSPTFLNLVLLSQVYEKLDLSSLKIITYGSEPMSRFTLDRITEIFPNARIIQKYGTSEFGSPHTKSMSDNNLWVKLDSDQFKVKIIENIMWIKAQTAMLGYLNAPNPMDKEGWICTGDEVEEKDGWLKILGRSSDIINVGGEKVYPAEVESVISRLEIVKDVLVKGEKHPFLGQCVTAIVVPNIEIEPARMRKEVKSYCKKHLQSYKVPTKIELTCEDITSPRHKKIRR
jgi:acyl-coenzyme A synthetase/AMP-(fatty) acid ligase